MHGRSAVVHGEGEAVSAAWLLPPEAQASCDVVDDLDPDVRHLVHEFGFNVVKAFDMAGIRDPRVIRRLVHAVWIGAAQPGNRPSRKIGQKAWPTLAVALEAGRISTVPALVHFLRASGVVMIPMDPKPCMVQASIAETGRLGLVSKEEKHRARLRAAIRAGAAHMFPEVESEWRR